MNRSTIFRQLIGAGLLVAAASVAQAQNPVTFQVDMSVAASGTTPIFGQGLSQVYARGDFNGWDTSMLLTNDSGAANPYLYSGTVDIPGNAGDGHQYKYYIDTGANWESPSSTCGNNRTFTLAGGAQTLPAIYFNDAPPVQPDNSVTFQVDMSAQIFSGNFDPGSGTVTVSGGFNGWGNSDNMTNNPALSGNASNVYSTVIDVQGVAGACQSFKYRMNGGWESPASTAGGNRTFQLAGGNQALPLVFYNDTGTGDYLAVDTAVTFNVNMIPGVTAAQDGSVVWDPSVNHVYINGDFLNWWGWGPFPPAQYELTNNPVGSSNYSLTLPFARGVSVATTYKYSIDGSDNEAGFAVNHLRYIRSYTNYNMPVDKFGTNPVPPVVEQSFGNLSAGKVTGGSIPVTWLGRPGVNLQTRTSANSGSWTDLPQTDATSATNWPNNTGPTRYFRLIKK